MPIEKNKEKRTRERWRASGNDERRKEEWENGVAACKGGEHALEREVGRTTEWKASATFSIYYAAAISYRETRRYVCSFVWTSVHRWCGYAWVWTAAGWYRWSRRANCRCGCCVSGEDAWEPPSVARISISTLLHERIFVEKYGIFCVSWLSHHDGFVFILLPLSILSPLSSSSLSVCISRKLNKSPFDELSIRFMKKSRSLPIVVYCKWNSFLIPKIV